MAIFIPGTTTDCDSGYGCQGDGVYMPKHECGNCCDYVGAGYHIGLVPNQTLGSKKAPTFQNPSGTLVNFDLSTGRFTVDREGTYIIILMIQADDNNSGKTGYIQSHLQTYEDGTMTDEFYAGMVSSTQYNSFSRTFVYARHLVPGNVYVPTLMYAKSGSGTCWLKFGWMQFVYVGGNE